MKTRHNFQKFILTAGLLVSTILGACAPVPTMDQKVGSETFAGPVTSVATAALVGDVAATDETGRTVIDQTPLSETVNQAATGPLTDLEREGILYMREEEKLARDVYLTFYETWPLPIFQNIANSESTHMEAVKTLIDRYGLEDPAADNDIGVFRDPTLQTLYNQLVAEGNKSLAAALRVGGAVEEIDILDLEERLTQTERADIKMVYENLMKGSRNHLRSFAATLEKQAGDTYQPQYLDQEAYDAIVSTPREAGGRGQGQGQRLRQGQRGS